MVPLEIPTPTPAPWPLRSGRDPELNCAPQLQKANRSFHMGALDRDRGGLLSTGAGCFLGCDLATMK